MTGIKLAISFVGTLGGIATSATGLIANVTAPITDGTPVTLAITASGVGLSALLAWTVRGIMKDQEYKVKELERRIAELEESR